MTVQDDDQLLVCRNSTPYNLKTQNLMAELLDDDLMLVCRSGTPYKATGLEIKESIGPQEAPPSLTSATLVDDNPTGADRYSNSSFTTSLSWATKGVPEASVEMQATVTGELSIAGATSEIVGVAFASAYTFTNFAVYPGFSGANKTAPDFGFNDATNYNYSDYAVECYFSTSIPWASGDVLDVFNYAGNYLSGGGVKLELDDGTLLDYSNATNSSNGGSTYLTYTIPAGRTSNKIVYSPGANERSNIFGLFVNGKAVDTADSSSVFTLASDTNRANGAFKAGDAVKQSNSPIVPTSSAIVSVALATEGTAIMYSMSSIPTNLASIPNEGTVATGGDSFSTSTYLVIVHQATAQVGGAVFASNGSAEFNFNGTTTGSGNYDAAGNRLGGSGSYNSSEWILATYGDDVNESYIVSLNAAYTVIGISVAGTIGSISEAESTTLTLQNSNGLSDFEVGNVVQEAGIWVASNIPTNTGNTVDKFVEAWNTGANNVFIDTTTTGQYIEFSVPSAGALLLKGGRTSSTDVNITATGDFNGGTRSWTWGLNQTSTQDFTFQSAGVVRLTVDNNSNGIYFFRNDCSFLGELFTLNNTVSIIAISESTPSITTDGGTWSVGEVVTGPSTDITATYVSADAAAKTMTVSDVVGPWSANTGRYVVNTVVNPVLIKPETSAITVVGGVPAPVTVTGMAQEFNLAAQAGIKSDLAYTNPGGPLSEDVNPDGIVPDKRKYPNYIGEEVTAYFNYNPPISTVDVVNVYGGAYNNGATQVTFTVNYSDGSSDNTTESSASNKWYWQVQFQTNGKSVVSVSLYSNNYLTAGGMTLGDNNFIAGVATKVLTLSDDTDLNQFATGDNIYAAGVAPASFAPVLYTGNGGTQSITTGFAPDLVWIKSRTDGSSHQLVDTVRGPRLRLCSNNTNAELDADNVTAFNPDGFTVGSSGGVNGAQDYVAWCWSAGGTTVTNNEGTIPSQVRSNGSFSVVKWNNGNFGGVTQSVGHALTSAPAFYVIKTLAADSWYTYHESTGSGKYLTLDTAGEALTNSVIWGNTSPSTSVFSVGTTFSGTGDYIAYCWAESPTQSFGSYTGNSGNNPIECGFEPAFVLIKNSSESGEQWHIYDSARNTTNPRDSALFANLANPEDTDPYYDINFTSTGFTLVNANAGINLSGRTYIYAAFASAGGPSGVVGDITGLDMTLSESSGTWEVGQKVTMDEKPAVVSTANVIFDQTGVVSGISTLPVAGQLILNKDTPKLTFTTPGTGQTWDEELPAGTKLQTTFVATNTEGSSSATSNTVTPGVTTLLAMGQTTTNKEELAQTIVQMETFDERKAIVEGEAAKSKIERKAEAAQNKVEAAQNKVKKAGL